MAASWAPPNIDCRQDGAKIDPSCRGGSYLFNTTIAGVADADAVLVVGANLRWESLAHQRAPAQDLLDVGAGSRSGLSASKGDLTYPVDYHLGAGAGESLQDAGRRVATPSHQVF